MPVQAYRDRQWMLLDVAAAVLVFIIVASLSGCDGNVMTGNITTLPSQCPSQGMAARRQQPCEKTGGGDCTTTTYFAFPDLTFGRSCCPDAITGVQIPWSLPPRASNCYTSKVFAILLVNPTDTSSYVLQDRQEVGMSNFIQASTSAWVNISMKVNCSGNVTLGLAIQVVDIVNCYMNSVNTTRTLEFTSKKLLSEHQRVRFERKPSSLQPMVSFNLSVSNSSCALPQPLCPPITSPITTGSSTQPYTVSSPTPQSPTMTTSMENILTHETRIVATNATTATTNSTTSAPPTTTPMERNSTNETATAASDATDANPLTNPSSTSLSVPAIPTSTVTSGAGESSSMNATIESRTTRQRHSTPSNTNGSRQPLATTATPVLGSTTPTQRDSLTGMEPSEEYKEATDGVLSSTETSRPYTTQQRNPNTIAPLPTTHAGVWLTVILPIGATLAGLILNALICAVCFWQRRKDRRRLLRTLRKTNQSASLSRVSRRSLGSEDHVVCLSAVTRSSPKADFYETTPEFKKESDHELLEQDVATTDFAMPVNFRTQNGSPPKDLAKQPVVSEMGTTAAVAQRADSISLVVNDYLTLYDVLEESNTPAEATCTDKLLPNGQLSTNSDNPPLWSAEHSKTLSLKDEEGTDEEYGGGEGISSKRHTSPLLQHKAQPLPAESIENLLAVCRESSTADMGQCFEEHLYSLPTDTISNKNLQNTTVELEAEDEYSLRHGALHTTKAQTPENQEKAKTASPETTMHLPRTSTQQSSNGNPATITEKRVSTVATSNAQSSPIDHEVTTNENEHRNAAAANLQPTTCIPIHDIATTDNPGKDLSLQRPDVQRQSVRVSSGATEQPHVATTPNPAYVTAASARQQDGTDYSMYMSTPLAALRCDEMTHQCTGPVYESML